MSFICFVCIIHTRAEPLAGGPFTPAPSGISTESVTESITEIFEFNKIDIVIRYGSP